MTGQPRLLFYKRSIVWPFESGHDIHTFHMMRSLGQAGARIGLVTLHRPAPEVLAGLPLDFEATFGRARDRSGANRPHLGWLEERFRSYWGVSREDIEDLRDSAAAFRADAVIVSGLEVLPMLAGIDAAVRIWYAADEWVLHHMSQVRMMDRSSWSNLGKAGVKGIYERAFRRRLERAWAVSDADRLALRWVAGVANVDVLPNGIDGQHYQPLDAPESPATAVFWGRLDFDPNIQALEWFCTRVWPGVLRTREDARFTIIGFKPSPRVEALAKLKGVRILPDLPDLRSEVARHAVVVLPFVSGGGIKNKLLEAAAMGKAVLGTRLALGGTREGAPLWSSDDPRAWPGLLKQLWAEPETRRRLGAQARDWVIRAHTWEAAAQQALAGIENSLRSRAS